MRVVIPHIADQFFWARTVHDLGAGLRPVRRARLSATALATSLHELVQDDGLRAAACPLGERIRAERGIDTAVQHIEEEFL